MKWLIAAGLMLTYVLGRPTLLPQQAYSGVVDDRHGRLMYVSLTPDERYRLRVGFDDVADVAKQTTLLYEDKAFFWHPGVNPWAMAKAAVNLLRGHSRRGASTLTMQVARLRFGLNSRHPWGKLVQILRALQLEVYYSKADILTAYFNLAPYGGNIEGIEAASIIYFGKSARALTLSEAMALAVLPQRPTARAPRPADQGMEPAPLQAARRKLAARYHGGSAEATDASAAPLLMTPRSQLPLRAPHTAVRLAEAGARVHTTVDLQLQELLQRRMRTYLAARASDGVTNAAALLLDTNTMEVLARLGSADFFDASIAGQVDGTRAPRSPGSALKPFIYALALQTGLIHPRTLLKDTPMRFGVYSPENFDGDFSGPLSATDALVRSRNVPAVYLETALRQQAHGDARAGLYGLLERAGVADLRAPEYYGLALALGGLELTMTELVELYAMLANQGVWRPVRDRLNDPVVAGVSLLSTEAAWLTLEMLRQSETAQGRRGLPVVRDAVDIAWKTGTSYGFRDAWTVGVSAHHVLAVWVGHFDAHGNPALVGRQAAAPLFFDMLEALRPWLRGGLRNPPEHVTEVEVCALSGGLPTAACSHRRKTWFIPGISPIAPCSLHRQVWIDPQTGARACPGDEANMVPQTYEFWPSDIAHLFDIAGLPRLQPPPYARRCALARTAEAGQAPQIVSPQSDVVYTVRASHGAHRALPLTATADGDVRQLHWFIDERLVGSSRRGEPLWWEAQAGDYWVRVVDDSGRSDAHWLRVGLVQ